MIKARKSPVMERLLKPVGETLNEDAARRLIALKADAELQARMDVLAEKCNQGTILPGEQDEYSEYISAGNLLNILKAMARVQLAKQR